MVLDTLSIPTMSADLERQFSSSKTVLTNTRTHLKGDVLEAL